MSSTSGKNSQREKEKDVKRSEMKDHIHLYKLIGTRFNNKIIKNWGKSREQKSMKYVIDCDESTHLETIKI